MSNLDIAANVDDMNEAEPDQWEHINYDPQDDEALYLDRVEFLNKCPAPEKAPDDEKILSCTKLQPSQAPDLVANLTLQSSDQEIIRALRKLRSSAATKAWNDMGNIGNHLADRQEREDRAALGLPEIKKAKRQLIDPTTGNDCVTNEDRQRAKKKIKQLFHEDHAAARLRESSSKSLLADTTLVVEVGPHDAGDSDTNYSEITSDYGGNIDTDDQSDTASITGDMANVGLTPMPTPADRPAKQVGVPVSARIDGVFIDKGCTSAYRVRSKESGARGLIRSMLNIADVSYWRASQRTWCLDGNPIPELGGFKFPRFNAEKVRDYIRKGHFAETYFKRILKLEPVPNDKLFEIPVTPGYGFQLNDENGIPMLVHCSNYYVKGFTHEMTDVLLELRNQTSPTKKQADATPGARGDLSSYIRGRDPVTYPTGSLNMSPSWISRGQDPKKARPSQHQLTGGKRAVVEGFTAIQHSFSRIGPLMTLQNYLLSKISPNSFEAHFQSRIALRKDNPAARAAGANDPSLFSGRSYIYNRRTPAHFDEKEAPEGWAPLSVLGDCETGCLALPHLGVKFKYLPGSLTFIRGKLLQHGVVDWDGKGNRICVANFHHKSEWNVAGVEPVF